MNIRKNVGFKVMLGICLLVFLTQYVLDTPALGTVRIPVGINIILYIGFYVGYLMKYRKENLLCFELMAIPVTFLGLFFDDIIYPFLPELSSFFSIGNEASKNKSEDIQMIAYFTLLLGCSVGNDFKKTTSLKKSMPRREFNYDTFIWILTGILLLLIAYDYYSGIFDSWFYYSNANWMDVEDRNQGLGHLTCILLAATGVELVRLRDKGASNLIDFIKRSNKLYLAEWIGISVLLYMSGNRNETLLILLPLVVGYTVYIHKIPNRRLILFGVVGVILMAVAGMTRQEEVSLGGGQLGLLSFTRDFADLGYNTDFLIDYTDKNEPTYFDGTFGMLLSGVPYLGSVILYAIDYKGPVASAILCTESVVSASGLGTSLIGDLYYTAGFAWVIVFMFFLGYLMSRLYHADQRLNIYWLVFYAYMVANAVYYIRSSWSFPITVIEYAFIIILLGNVFFKEKINLKKHVNK